MAILLSCVIAFRDADFLKHLYRYRWLAGSLGSVALVSVFSWVFREYEAAPFRSVKPYLTLVAIIPLVLAMRTLNFRRWHISFITILAGLSLGTYALSEVWEGTHGRWDATENAVEFGNYAALIGGLLLILSTQLHTAKCKWPIIGLSLVGSLAAFYVSYKSGTRSSAGIALLAAFCVCGYLLFSLKNWFVLALLGTCFVGAAFTISETGRFSTLESELSKAFAGGYSSGSLGQRLELWRLSGCIVSEFPVLGAGTGSFKYAQLDHWPESCGVRLWAPKGYYSQAHSAYFQSLATMGYLGLVSLMALFAMLISAALLNIRSGGLFLAFVVSSFMVAGITVDLFFKDFMVARFVLLTSLCLVWLQHNDTGGLKGVT
ncbi:MAG: O-antigen ligase family protein [Thalassolituus maritimus]|nr:MAG: O-antigen ligase family protein [Thalassolituus maritimus]